MIELGDVDMRYNPAIVLLERAEKEELEEVGALEDLEGGEGENR
jgi:hypothetical protein